MTLADLLDPRRAVVPLAEPSLVAAGDELIERIVEAGAVQDEDKLRSRVQEVRGEDVVALGDRALMMHYRTDAVRDLSVAIGISPVPVRLEAGEGESPAARIVLLVVSPPRLAARYLQVLGAFARALSNHALVDAMLAAQSAGELASLAQFAEYRLPEHLAVRDVMTDRPRTTAPETLLRDAAQVMARAAISALPVVEPDGLLVGMLSERELMRHLVANYLQGGAGARSPDGGVPVIPPGVAPRTRRTVRDVMTRQVLCVSPDQPLADVASLMTNKDVGGVPVVREGRVVGFLTRGDIIRKLIGS